MKPNLAPVEDCGPTAPRKVFIVEDHPVFREGLVQIINSEGDLTVCGEAEDAEHALKAIPGLKPDLVLVDIQMPRLDGYGVLRELRADPRLSGLHVVALTAYAMQGDRDRALDAGFDGYITKPVDIAALRQEVKRFL